MPRAKQRTPEMRERVLHASVEMLGRDGVHAFTTRRVAQEAGTSPPAVYELFGDKAGLVRQVFFEGFRRLWRQLEALAQTDDPHVDLVAVMEALRLFGRANPVLAELMFAHPFADFDPGPNERAAASGVRELIVGRVRRCINAGVVAGDATDIAHGLLALAQGLVTQESAGWLGTSRASMNRRWSLAVNAMIDGLRP